MRILIYSYNYAPEPIGIAPLMTELAEGLVKRGHEVRADEPRLAGHLGRQFGEPLLGGGVAINSDQRAGGSDPVGQQPRVTATADGAVHRDLTRARIKDIDQLAGENRDVRPGHVKQCRQDSP